MKPDRPVDSIIWGKKYSLKDRSPQVALIMLLFILMGLFFGVSKCDETHLNSSKELDSEPVQ